VSDAPLLRLDGVWKGYRDLAFGPRTLRSSLVGGDLLRRLRAPVAWALRDVSLELREGESLGVVGRNGAGKSTLLRLASHLGRPTRGTVEVTPRAASVLNLGASFDVQLTGRENAYTAALVAGATAREARRMLPEALEFAELGAASDAPVRTYSDGMRLRLAFGVVAVQRPRLLVLDEVLAVGDVGFREKCTARIRELRADGAALVLASHSAYEIATECERAIWLHRGEVRATGPAGAVVEAYEQATREATLVATPAGLGPHRFGSQHMTFERVALSATRLRRGDPLEVVLETRADEPVAAPRFTVVLRRPSDGATVLELASDGAPVQLGGAVRGARVRLRLERLDLVPGSYELDVGVYEADWEVAYDFRWAAATIEVEGGPGAKGLLAPPAGWSLEQTA
jgi:lipopolysaccharide transport system ATP-binding protein